MQILESFRNDSPCFASTWQPLVGSGGMKWLLAAFHLKKDHDCIHGFFSNALFMLVQSRDS